MASIGQALALLDHGVRDIDGIDAVDSLNEVASQGAGTATHIQDDAWPVGNQIGKDVEDGGRIR